jgi:hypothetical protein
VLRNRTCFCTSSTFKWSFCRSCIEFISYWNWRVICLLIKSVLQVYAIGIVFVRLVPSNLVSVEVSRELIPLVMLFKSIIHWLGNLNYLFLTCFNDWYLNAVAEVNYLTCHLNGVYYTIWFQKSSQQIYFNNSNNY